MRTRARDWYWSAHLALALLLSTALLAAGCAGEARPSPAADTSRGPVQAATAAPAAERAGAAGQPSTAVAAPEVDPDTRNASLAKIVVAYSSYSNPFTPLFVAKEAGLFEKYGLDVDLTYVASGPTVTQGLLAGEIAFAGVGGSVIDSRLEGSDLIIIAEMVPVLLFSIYGDPAIGSIQDLRGKTLATTRRGGAADSAGRLALARSGLVPDQDVMITNVGTVGAILAAIQEKIVAAGVISAPTTLRARDLGLKEILNISDLRIPFPHDVVATSAQYARQNPDIVRRFLKGYIEGIKRTREDKPLGMQAIGKYTRTEEPRLQEEAYDNVVGIFPRLPLVSAEMVQAALDESSSPRAREASPGEFYDNNYVEALRSWTEQLYQR